MGDDNTTGTFPRSMRQKRILDAAKSNPDASIEELADIVPSATPTLIESTIEEYGDPATENKSDTDTDAEQADSTSPATKDQSGLTSDTLGESNTEPDKSSRDDVTQRTTDGLPSVTDLSSAQQEVLREVATDPTATQESIGNRLGISGSAVSNRLKDITGFDWRNRESFIDETFTDHTLQSVVSDGGVTQEVPDEETDETVESENPNPEALDEIKSTLERIETTLSNQEAISSNGETDPTAPLVLEDPDLVHRVVHACLKSDSISESEELDILRAILT